MLQIIDIIHRKKMEDIFAKKKTYKGPEIKFEDLLGNPIGNQVINLDNIEAHCYKSEKDYITINQLISSRMYRPLLDYDKAILIKEDIELQRSRQAYEESIAF